MMNETYYVNVKLGASDIYSWQTKDEKAFDFLKNAVHTHATNADYMLVAHTRRRNPVRHITQYNFHYERR